MWRLKKHAAVPSISCVTKHILDKAESVDLDRFLFPGPPCRTWETPNIITPGCYTFKSKSLVNAILGPYSPAPGEPQNIVLSAP